MANVSANATIVRRTPAGALHFRGAAAANAAAVGVAYQTELTAASSGDTIEIHADMTTTSHIGKNGVDIWVAPGVMVERISGADGLIDDSSFGSNGALVFKIGGNGHFRQSVAGGVTFSITNSGSSLVVDAHTIDTTHADGGTALSISAGTIRVRAHTISSAGYDAIIYSSPLDCYIDAQEIVSTSAADPDANAIEIAGSGGTCYVRAGRIESDGDAITSPSGTSTLVISANKIIADDDAVKVAGGTVNILSGQITSGAGDQDLEQSSGGVIRVSPAVRYDSAKTSGTITKQEIFGAAPGATGLALLDDTTASAARDTLGATSGVFPVAAGGSGAGTLTGLLQGNGTGAFTGVTNSTTVGQALRVTGSNTYGWGALDLADSDATTGDLPFSAFAQGVALSVLGVTGNATADHASIAAGSDHQALRRSGTSVAFGALDLSQAAATTNQLPVAKGGTGAATLTGVLKGNGTSAFTAATAGTDYVVPGVGLTAAIAVKTANYTLTANDHTIICNVTGLITMTLPAAASNTGRIYSICTIHGTGSVTIDANASEQINNNGSDNATLLLADNSAAVIIQCDGTKWYVTMKTGTIEA